MDTAPPSSQDTSKGRPITARILKWSLIAAATVAALIIVVRLLIGSSVGRSLIESQVEKLDIRGVTVTLDEFQGDVLSNARIGRVTLSDPKGVWLTVDDLRLDWRPMRLAARALWVDSLTAAKVDYIRPPELEPSDTPPSASSGATPPGRLEIGELAVKEIVLRFDGADDPVLLSLDAAAAWARDGGRLNLHLKPRNSSGDRADIALVWDRSRLVNGTVDLRSAQDGIIARFAPDLRLGDLTARFVGEGDINDWTGAGAIASNGSEALTLTGRSEKAKAQIRIDADFTEAPILPVVTERLGDVFTLSATADLTDRKVAPVTLAVAGDRLNATVSGRIDRSNSRLADVWTFNAETPALAALSGVARLSADQVGITGEARFDAGRLRRIDARASASGLSHGGRGASELSAIAGADIRGDVVTADLSFTGVRPVTGVGRVDALLGEKASGEASGSYDHSARRLSLAGAALRGELATADLKGDIRMQGDIRLDGAVRLSSLSSLSSSLEGRTDATVKIARKGADGPVAITLDGLAAGLSSDQTTLSSLLGPTAAYQAGATLFPGAGQQFDVTLTSGETRLSGKGRIRDKSLDISFGGAADSLDFGAGGLTVVTLDGRLQGPVGRMSLDLAANAASGAVAGRDLKDADASFTGWLSDGALSGRVSLSGLADGSPLRANAGVSTGDMLEISDLTAVWSDLTLEADITKAKGQSVAGRFALAGPLPVRDVKGVVSARGDFSGKTFNIDASLQRYASAGVSLSDAHITASGAPDNVIWSLDATGERTSRMRAIPLALKASGTLLSKDGGRLLTASFNGLYDDAPLRSRSPVTVRLRPESRDIDADIALLDGVVTLALTDEPGSADLSLHADSLALARLMPLLGRSPVSGAAGLDLTWRSRNGVGKGDASLSLDKIASVGESASFVDVRLTGRAVDGALILDMTARSNEGLTLQGHARTRYGVSGEWPTFDIDATPVALTLDGDGDLGALWTLAGVDTIDLDGAFKVTAKGDAPLGKLRPVGTFSLRNGTFEQSRFGARMRDITIDTVFDDTSLRIVSASARGVDGGRISAEGELFLDPARPSALNLDFDKFVAIKRTGQFAQVSGRGQIDKETTGVTITGDLGIDRAELDITTLRTGRGIPTVEVVFPNGDDEDEEAGPEESARPLLVRLDVKLKADNQVFVRGGGLDVEMSADTAIRGPLTDVGVYGQARVVRGGFDLAGQQFDFTSGRLDLSGDPRQGQLNLQANRNSGGVQATLLVTGPVVDPKIQLTSSPALPEDEILSRLLFGRSPSELSGLEAAQLAASIASLATTGSGLDPFADVRDSLGLDRLTLRQSDSGAAQVGAGKYLSKDVYLELRSSPEGGAGVAVEWEPRDNVEIGTEFQPTGDARVTVQWKKDYD